MIYYISNHSIFKGDGSISLREFHHAPWLFRRRRHRHRYRSNHKITKFHITNETLFQYL